MPIRPSQPQNTSIGVHSRGAAIVSDAARMPFPDESADLVIAFMCLHDFDDMSAAVAEAAPHTRRLRGSKQRKRRGDDFGMSQGDAVSNPFELTVVCLKIRTDPADARGNPCRATWQTAWCRHGR